MEDTWSSFTKYLLIFIILAILGINVFYYLARGTDAVVDASKGVVGATTSVASGAVKMTEKGAETAVDVATGATKDAVRVTGGVLTSTMKGLEDALDIKVDDGSPHADDSGSSVQNPRKAGYCYIGSEKGFRSCLYVGKRDMCMSGDVYPTMDICINPKLRV